MKAGDEKFPACEDQIYNYRTLSHFTDNAQDTLGNKQDQKVFISFRCTWNTPITKRISLRKTRDQTEYSYSCRDILLPAKSSNNLNDVHLSGTNRIIVATRVPLVTCRRTTAYHNEPKKCTSFPEIESLISEKSPPLPSPYARHTY